MKNNQLAIVNQDNLPLIVAGSGAKASEKFIEFFFATIRNKNTREAYARAVMKYLDFMAMNGVTELSEIRPLMVAAYIEQHPSSLQTIKQHLSAITKMFDYLAMNQIIDANPAASVKGPKYSYSRGKTPVLTPDQTRQLIDSIDIETPLGLRDRALIGAMVYSFARISAVLAMDTDDYFAEGKRWMFRLHEKGGKEHYVPVHHKEVEYIDEYIEAWDIEIGSREPLWLTKNGNRLNRHEAWNMIKRRVNAAGLPLSACNHTFRATGITTFLENDGKLEKAQQIAAHASTKTTKLYDRRDDDLTQDEIERIRI